MSGTPPPDRPASPWPEDWAVWLSLAICLALGLLAWNALPAAPQPMASANWADKGVWERAYFVTNTLLVGIALVALIGAYFQARAARDQAREILHTRRANVFLEIQARWSSDKVLTSREQYTKLRERHRVPGGGFDGTAISAELTAMRADPARLPEHIALMQMPNFFETLGLLVEQDYIDIDDVRLLVGGSVRAVMAEIADHIAWMRTHIGNPKIYVLAEKLASRL